MAAEDPLCHAVAIDVEELSVLIACTVGREAFFEVDTGEACELHFPFLFVYALLVEIYFCPSSNLKEVSDCR
jgi:hypothetical protein